MAERFTSDLAFILIALIVAALLGFIIGLLLRRIRKARFIALENEKDELRVKLDVSARHLERTTMQLDECRKQLKECMTQKSDENAFAFNADAAKSVFNTRIIENDLKIVEGIGEKIAGILNNRGIHTWHDLSKTSPEKIKEILLADGGPSYKIHEPATWPEQALLAYEGKWAELKDLQQQLSAGRQN